MTFCRDQIFFFFGLSLAFSRVGITTGDEDSSKKAVKGIKLAGEKYLLKYKELWSKYRQVIVASSDDDRKKEWQDRLEEVKEDYKMVYAGIQSS